MKLLNDKPLTTVPNNISSKRIVLCLGSNVGDRKSYLDKACKLIEKNLQLKNTRKSNILQNKALLLPNSPEEWDIDFYNIAFSGDIDLNKFPPINILEIIKKIEIDLGRKDRGKWSPREIDIDIAIVENLRINLGNKLQIPHKNLLDRDFFIKTIKEIEPLILKEPLNN
jgi:2-amino-4-hydroxy-6-hydroxymethyldihydropteridine diphosphokinase